MAAASAPAPHDTPELDAALRDLTPAQREAVLRTEGPVLVLAGPGSGKTRVITRRMAHLIGCGVPAWQILAVTFTNKAAAEMRERVAHLLGEGPMTRGLTVTTFHALCARLLRRHLVAAPVGGLLPTFTICDAADQAALMKKVIEALHLSTANFPARSMLSRVSALKNGLVSPEAYAQGAGDFSSRVLAQVYAAYQRALRGANSADFDDLLLLATRMLREHAAVRDECRRRWQYLLIDEYQDTNHAQFILASLLAGEGGARGGEGTGGGGGPNICVVGDPDQSIYAWRGADITNILNFERQYPGACTIALGENFRSTASILAAADAMIRHNQRRKHKDLIASRGAGAKAEVVLTRDEHDEARAVLDWLRERDAGGDAAWKDMAVFYRTNALSRVIEDALRNAGVPYVVARGTAFYQREEIKNALAYLRVVANPADPVSLARIVNTPARGIGATTWSRIEHAAAERGVSEIEALREAGRGGVAGVSARAAGAIGKFLEMVEAWRGGWGGPAGAGEASLHGLVERVVKESGLERMYKADGDDAGESRLENLEELISSAAEFEAGYDAEADPAGEPGAPPAERVLAMVRAYLERVTLVADADSIDPAQGAVTLMTLHAAKGLEFRAAVIVGLEEGTLPHSRAFENDEQLEEERRLCFVGITRAMDRLLLTSAKYRTMRGVPERTMPSRFLRELPTEHVEYADRSGAFAPGYEWEERDLDKGAGGAAGGGGEIVAGVLVRHPQFGLGKVLAVTRGRDARARIAFRDVGEKTLVLEYARLEKVRRE